MLVIVLTMYVFKLYCNNINYKLVQGKVLKEREPQNVLKHYSRKEP